jgi:hypothetical protein
MLADSGILLIDGDPVPTRTWQEVADEVIASSNPRLILGEMLSGFSPH